jgi:hypothetical protein
MDWFDLAYYAVLSLIIALPIILVATIGLRVACHFAGADIPAIGRALFTAFLTWGLSLTIGALLQAALIGLDVEEPDLALQFVVFAFALLAGMLLTVGLYLPLLGVRIGKALTIWIIQIVFVIGVALFLSCLIGALSALSASAGWS